MMVGAILTQATQWRNVEQAIAQLEQAKVLSPERLVALPRTHLQQLIRPSGYFRQKAKRLSALTSWYLRRYQGRPARMFRTPWPTLRRELLSLDGIGPETADSILLYAGHLPVFVVDAYTIRVLHRHFLIGSNSTYDTVQQRMMRTLPRDAQLYNEFHALLVAVGKRFCHRHDPDCAHCPLGDLPHTR